MCRPGQSKVALPSHPPTRTCRSWPHRCRVQQMRPACTAVPCYLAVSMWALLHDVNHQQFGIVLSQVSSSLCHVLLHPDWAAWQGGSTV